MYNKMEEKNIQILNDPNFIKAMETAVIEQASKGEDDKRKVGAIIFDFKLDQIVGRGFNTKYILAEDFQHAEITAINNWKNKTKNLYLSKEERLHNDTAIFVSYQPCPNCLAEIAKMNINTVIVINEFLKFDDSKPRYDLIPVEVLRGLADVLTYGAHKYKPNNWKECKDTDRYIAALMRHIEAYRGGEKIDKESGLHHLAHAATNIAFLLHLDEDIKNESN